MAFISKTNADNYRNDYLNATFTRQKNIEAALFDLDEVKTLINRVENLLPVDENGRKHLKVFMIYENGHINLCMTGGAKSQNTVNPLIGKPEIDTDLDADGANDTVLALPCPPHCGESDLVPGGHDNKYVTI